MKYKLINIENKWYLLLGMYGGSFYAGGLYDLNNDLKLSGIIWERESFFYGHDKWYGLLYGRFVYMVRGLISLYKKIKKYIVLFETFSHHCTYISKER